MQTFNLRFILSILAFMLPFSVYLITSYPDLTFTDNGELAAVANSLGVAHPSGYPLFTLLGHIWSLIPMGLSPIKQMNIFSSFVTAFSIAMFFNLILELFNALGTKSRNLLIHSKPALIIAFISAMSFAFLSLVWEQGLYAEVYSLHLLMTTLTLFFAVRAYALNDEKLFILSALSLGLSFSNHLTSFMLIIPLIILYFSSHKIYSLKNILFLVLAFSLGLSLYIYLPLRSASNPEFDWGGVSRGLDKFLYHVQGKQYQVWMFTGTQAMKDNLPKMMQALFEHWYLWIGFVAFGFSKLYKHKAILFSLLSLVLVNVIYSLNYSIHDISHYFLPSLFVLLLAFAYGLHILFFMTKIKEKIYLLAIIPIALFSLNLSDMNHSEDYLVSEYTNIVIDNLEQNAIIIGAQWDYWNAPFWYQQRIEGKRKDIILIEKELLRRTWYPEQLVKWYPELAEKCSAEIKQYQDVLELFESGLPYNRQHIQSSFINMLNSFIDKFYDERPIYITLDLLQSEKQVASTYIKIPEGFAFRLYKESDLLGKSKKVDLSQIKLDKFISSMRDNPNHLESGIVGLASNNLINISRYSQQSGHIDNAIKSLEMAISLDKNNANLKQTLAKLKSLK